MSTFNDLLRQTVTITNRSDGIKDAYNVPAKTTTGTVTACAYLEPIDETSQLVEAETYITRWKLFLLPDVVIDADDLVTDANEVVYQVLEVLPFTNARSGVLHHIECKLAQVQG